MASETPNRLTFEQGNSKAFDGIELGKPDQLTVVDSPYYPGKKVARILQRPGDLWMGKYVRCLCAKYDTAERAGQHYRYLISTVFLSEFGPYGNNLLWELHHRSNLYNLGNLGVAPLAITTRNGLLGARVAAGLGTVGRGYQVWLMDQTLAPIAYDRRVDIGIDLLCDEQNGHFHVWVNATGTPDPDMFSKPPQFKHDGPTLPYSNTGQHVGPDGLYQELGIYSGASSVSSIDGLHLFGSIREEGSSDMKAAIRSIGQPGPAPPPTPAPGTPLVARSSIQAGDPLELGAKIAWKVDVTAGGPADRCDFFIDGANIGTVAVNSNSFTFTFTVPRCKTIGFEVTKGTQKLSFKAYPVSVHDVPLPPPPATAAQLRDEAVAELKLTTVGFKNTHWTTPPGGSKWANGLGKLAQIK